MSQQHGREVAEWLGWVVHEIGLDQAPAYAGTQGYGEVRLGQVVL